GRAGICVVPVSWRRVARDGSYEAVLPARTLELSGAGPDAAAALTLDRASRWRAADMAGMLLQGRASLFEPASARRGRRDLVERPGGGDGLALVRTRPHRIAGGEGGGGGNGVA